MLEWNDDSLDPKKLTRAVVDRFSQDVRGATIKTGDRVQVAGSQKLLYVVRANGDFLVVARRGFKRMYHRTQVTTIISTLGNHITLTFP